LPILESVDLTESVIPIFVCAFTMIDEDCEGDLTCFLRVGEEAVPGCIGFGEEEYAYCI
jgi:hypothetical protein